jgi:copper(I)-binding protein
MADLAVEHALVSSALSPAAACARLHAQPGPRVRSPSRRCAGAAVKIGLSMLLLAGCAALNRPDVSREHNYGDVSIGDLHVRAVRPVKASDDRAVGVVVTIVNYGPPDVLSEVTVKAGNANGLAGTVTPLRAEPNLTIPADAVVRVGGPGNPRILMPDPQRHLRAGRVATVTLSFTVAGVAAVEAIVEEPGAYLVPFAPPPTTGRAP